MHQRCKSDDWRYRHISVCARWSGSKGLERFVEDMGPTYFPGAHLDRTDNRGDYSPANCQWLTPEEHKAKHAAHQWRPHRWR